MGTTLKKTDTHSNKDMSAHINKKNALQKTQSHEQTVSYCLDRHIDTRHAVLKYFESRARRGPGWTWKLASAPPAPPMAVEIWGSYDMWGNRGQFKSGMRSVILGWASN